MEEITKLKAEVYDLLAQQEHIQRLLQEKNQEIAKLSAQPKSEPVEPEKK